MGNRRRLAWFIAALAGVALAAAGCGDSDGGGLGEQLIEEGAERSGAGDVDVDIDEENGEFSVRGEDGEGSFSIGGSSELPDDFPDDFPFPDDTTITGSFSAEQEGSSGFSVTANTSASHDEVVSFYEEALPAGGYEIEGTSTASGGGTETVTMGIAGPHGGAVTVAAGDDSTTISIILEQAS